METIQNAWNSSAMKRFNADATEWDNNEMEATFVSRYMFQMHRILYEHWPFRMPPDHLTFSFYPSWHYNSNINTLRIPRIFVWNAGPSCWMKYSECNVHTFIKML